MSLDASIYSYDSLFSLNTSRHHYYWKQLTHQYKHPRQTSHLRLTKQRGMESVSFVKDNQAIISSYGSRFCNDNGIGKETLNGVKLESS